MVGPGQTIAFAEIVFADALTSLSKVFKDFVITIIVVYSSVSQTPITDLHEEDASHIGQRSLPDTSKAVLGAVRRATQLYLKKVHYFS